jgi:hypothetical protein
MATCYKCGGFKTDFGECASCAKIASDERLAAEQIRSDERLAEEQREASRVLANRNLNLQIELAKVMATDANKKHNQLMEMEEQRLLELKKQTQILIEQGLTTDEVYQIGFNFKESPLLIDYDGPWVSLQLDERGNIFAIYDSPYVQEKFRKAFQNGVEDRFKKDYSKGPGVEFMTEAAFNLGFSRAENATIYFPNEEKQRFFYNGHYDLKYSEYVNDEDGSIICNYETPYESDLLNQSFQAGIDKFLAEKNSLEEKSKRLSLIKQKKKIERANRTAFKKLKAQEPTSAQIVEASKKYKSKLSNKRIAIADALLGAILGALIGAIAAIPIFFFIWFFSFFFGGTSWTLAGFTMSCASICAIFGFFVGNEKGKINQQ